MPGRRALQIRLRVEDFTCPTCGQGLEQAAREVAFVRAVSFWRVSCPGLHRAMSVRVPAGRALRRITQFAYHQAPHHPVRHHQRGLSR